MILQGCHEHTALRVPRPESCAGLFLRWRRGRAVVGIVFLLVCLTSINGCGFKLRGMSADARQLPAVFIRSERGSTLMTEIHKVFRQAGVTLADRRELATWVLTLSDEQRHRRVLSVGVSGKVQEFELKYSVDYTLTAADEQPVIDKQTLALFRDYSFTGSDVLAKDDEEEKLYQGMQQQAAEIILRRLLIHQDTSPVRTEPGGQDSQPGGDVDEAGRAL